MTLKAECIGSSVGQSIVATYVDGSSPSLCIILGIIFMALLTPKKLD